MNLSEQLEKLERKNAELKQMVNYKAQAVNKALALIKRWV